MIDKTIKHYLGDNPPSARLLYGADVREGLKKVADSSIQTICTSPPYYGLRDYGTATWVGGDPNCKHFRDNKIPQHQKSGHVHMIGEAVGDSIYKDVCKKCGAKRVDAQIGLEDTIEGYIDSMVSVFDACKRVLRKDGLLWVNLGDTYVSQGGAKTEKSYMSANTGNSSNQNLKVGARKPSQGLKPKNLIGIPWRVALALQADGWILRNDIIWTKDNPMPESVRDRMTKAHEYVFMFAHPDSGGKYYFDQDAIREPICKGTHERNQYGWKNKQPMVSPVDKRGIIVNRNQLSEATLSKGRNKRTVWNVNPVSYSGAHFACWPPGLVKPMILSASAPGDTVLDPFSGSATTGQVALSLGRNYVGTDLNEDYCKLAEGRLTGLKPSRKPKEEIKTEASTLDLFGSSVNGS